MSRLSSVIFVSALALAGLAATGCGPQTVMPFTAEVDDPDYRRGKELLRMGRDAEALKMFLKVIDARGGAAADSHLDVAIIYQRHIGDPISAIYHYRRYREMRPNTEQARLALQSIEACIRDFARSLPGRPLENQDDRATALTDAVDRLQRENLQLKEQLAAARASVLDTTRPGPAPVGNASTPGGFAAPFEEPSQNVYTPGGATPAPRPAPSQNFEYSAPVGVAPVPTTPANPPAPVTPVAPVSPVGANPGVTPGYAPAPVGPSTPPPTGPVTPPPGGAVRRHVVAKGDTLQSIAFRYYGSRSRFRDLLAANRDQLPNENTPLRIGMELRIPQ